MFGRKKKKQEEPDAQAVLANLNNVVTEIEKLENPAEKLFKVETLRAAILEQIDDKGEEVEKRGMKRWMWTFAGGNLAQMGVFFGAMVATAAFPVGLLAFPAMFGVAKLTNMHTKKFENKLKQEQAAIVEGLETLERRLGAISDRLIDEHMEAISKSPKRDLIFDKFPDVKSRFGLAAARKMAAQDSPAPKTGPKKEI